MLGTIGAIGPISDLMGGGSGPAQSGPAAATGSVSGYGGIGDMAKIDGRNNVTIQTGKGGKSSGFSVPWWGWLMGMAVGGVVAVKVAGKK